MIRYFFSICYLLCTIFIYPIARAESTYPLGEIPIPVASELFPSAQLNQMGFTFESEGRYFFVSDAVIREYTINADGRLELGPAYEFPKEQVVLYGYNRASDGKIYLLATRDLGNQTYVTTIYRYNINERSLSVVLDCNGFVGGSINSKAIYSRDPSSGDVKRIDLQTGNITYAQQKYKVGNWQDSSVRYGITACEGWVAIWSSNYKGDGYTPVTRQSEIVALNEDSLEQVGQADEVYSRKIVNAWPAGSRLITATGKENAFKLFYNQISIWNGPAELASPFSLTLDDVPAPTSGMSGFDTDNDVYNAAGFLNIEVRGNGVWMSYCNSKKNCNRLLHYSITESGSLINDLNDITNFQAAYDIKSVKFMTQRRALQHISHMREAGEIFDGFNLALHDLDSPRARLELIPLYAHESESNLELLVRLSRPVATPVTFRINTLSDTALEGVDFSGINQYYTIPAGHSELRIPITFYKDTVREANESFKTLISDLNGALCSFKEQFHTIASIPISISTQAIDTYSRIEPFEDGSYLTFHYIDTSREYYALYHSLDSSEQPVRLKEWAYYHFTSKHMWKDGDVIYVANSSYAFTSWNAVTGISYGLQFSGIPGVAGWSFLVPGGKGYSFSNTNDAVTLTSLADRSLDEFYSISPSIGSFTNSSVGYAISDEYLALTYLPYINYSLGAPDQFSLRVMVFRRSDAVKILDLSYADIPECSASCKIVGNVLLVNQAKIAINISSGIEMWSVDKRGAGGLIHTNKKHVFYWIGAEIYARDLYTGALQGPISLPKSPDSDAYYRLNGIIGGGDSVFVNNGLHWLAVNPAVSAFPNVIDNEIIIQKKTGDYVLDLNLVEEFPHAASINAELIASDQLKKGLSLVRNRIELPSKAVKIDLPFSISEYDLNLPRDELKFQIKLTYTVGGKQEEQIINGFIIDNVHIIYNASKHLVHTATHDHEADRIAVGNNYYAINYPKAINEDQSRGFIEVFRISDDQLMHVILPPSGPNEVFGAQVKFSGDTMFVDHGAINKVYAYDAVTGQLRHTFVSPKKQSGFGTLLETSPGGIAICSKLVTYKPGRAGKEGVTTYACYVNLYDKNTFKLIWSKKIPYNMASVAYSGGYFYVGLPDISVKFKDPTTKKSVVIPEVGGVVSFHEAKGKTGPSFSSLFPDRYDRVGSALSGVGGRIWTNSPFVDRSSAFLGQARRGLISWNSNATSHYGLGCNPNIAYQFSQNFWGQIVCSSNSQCIVIDPQTGNKLFQTDFGFSKSPVSVLPPSTPGVAIGKYLYVQHDGNLYKLPFEAMGGFDNWMAHRYNTSHFSDPEGDKNLNGVADFDDYVIYLNETFGPMLQWETPTEFGNIEGQPWVMPGRASIGKYFYSADMMWKHQYAESGRVFSGYKTNELAWRDNYNPYLTLTVRDLEMITYSPRYWW